MSYFCVTWKWAGEVIWKHSLEDTSENASSAATRVRPPRKRWVGHGVTVAQSVIGGGQEYVTDVGEVCSGDSRVVSGKLRIIVMTTPLSFLGL
ncbi:hypothetical protein MRX96_036459 [Rhipicephalus microplus]